MFIKLHIIFIITLVIILTAPGVSSQDCHPGIQRIKDKGKLVVAVVNADHPPLLHGERKG